MSKEVSDEVVIVTEYDPLSAAGVERLKGLLREDLTYIRTWILLNKMLPDFVDTFSDFLEVAKYLSPIPWDSNVVRAYSRRLLAVDMEYGNEYTLSIIQTIKGLLGDEIAEEIESWAKDRAASIRQPIEEQYKDAEVELKGLLHEKTRYEKQRIQQRIIRYGSIFIFPFVIIAVLISNDFFGIIKESFSVFSRSLMNIVMVVSAIILPAGFYILAKYEKKGTDFEIEEARFNRQISILNEKLKQLEILRKADLDTLIKSRK